MPRKKKTNGTISQEDGLNKLKKIKETLPPTPPDTKELTPEEITVVPVSEEKKPVSGIFRSIYPLVVDLLCHVLNKEKFSDSRKSELLENVSQDLDELERKYIPETVQNHPGVKALSITGLAIAFQPKAKKEPKKEPEAIQPDTEKKPEPPAPSALGAESSTVAQPAQ
jgi:hypothetical protein